MTNQARRKLTFTEIAFLGVILSALSPSVMGATATDDSYNVQFGTATTIAPSGVLDNDCCASRDPISAVLVDSPTDGTLTLNSDGGFTYTHDGVSTAATDTFTYQAEDSTGLSNIATVTLNVVSANPIEANPDSFSVTLGQSLVVNPPGVLSNDTDPDGDPLTAILASSPTLGSLTFNADGSFTYDYAGTDPAEDSFTYQATDGSSTTDPVTVTITIDAAGGTGSTAGLVQMTFSAVGGVGFKSPIGGKTNEVRLIISSESGAPAAVQGPGVPLQSSQLVAVVRLNNLLDTARDVMSRCERLALVAQARPTKYDLQVTISVEDTSTQITGDAERISVVAAPADVECDLLRPMPPG